MDEEKTNPWNCSLEPGLTSRGALKLHAEGTKWNEIKWLLSGAWFCALLGRNGKGQAGLGWSPAFPLTCCVTLGKLLPLSEPQFLVRESKIQ